MSNDAQSPGGAFDLKKLRRLIELMDQHDLSEVDLREGDMRVRLRRPSSTPQGIPLVAGPPAAIPYEPQQGPALQQPGSVPAPAEEKSTEITSPMVGTFYSASAPDDEPYVRVGSHVDANTTVCIIEAMKVFNEIEAEVAGEIVEVLVENGQAVEFSQPLFRVRPSS